MVDMFFDSTLLLSPLTLDPLTDQEPIYLRLKVSSFEAVPSVANLSYHVHSIQVCQYSKIVYASILPTKVHDLTLYSICHSFAHAPGL
eukprot:g30852.t1